MLDSPYKLQHAVCTIISTPSLHWLFAILYILSSNMAVMKSDAIGIAGVSLPWLLLGTVRVERRMKKKRAMWPYKELAHS